MTFFLRLDQRKHHSISFHMEPNKKTTNRPHTSHKMTITTTTTTKVPGSITTTTTTSEKTPHWILPSKKRKLLLATEITTSPATKVQATTPSHNNYPFVHLQQQPIQQYDCNKKREKNKEIKTTSRRATSQTNTSSQKKKNNDTNKNKKVNRNRVFKENAAFRANMIMPEHTTTCPSKSHSSVPKVLPISAIPLHVPITTIPVVMTPATAHQSMLQSTTPTPSVNNNHNNMHIPIGCQKHVISGSQAATTKAEPFHLISSIILPNVVTNTTITATNTADNCRNIVNNITNIIHNADTSRRSQSIMDVLQQHQKSKLPSISHLLSTPPFTSSPQDALDVKVQEVSSKDSIFYNPFPNNLLHANTLAAYHYDRTSSPPLGQVSNLTISISAGIESKKNESKNKTPDRKRRFVEAKLDHEFENVAKRVKEEAQQLLKESP